MYRTSGSQHLNKTNSKKHNLSKLFKWFRIISITGFSQIIVQGMGLFCGIMVIRLLPTQEYALYTLANTMLGTMLVLADGGISSGVMSLGGKVWQDRKKLGTVLKTGLDLRNKFALVSLLAASPVLIYLLHHHGASWLLALLILLSLIPAFIMALSGSLLEIVPKLHQDIYSLQKIQVGTNFGRLTLLGLSLFLFPVAAVAVIASGIPQVWANIRLRKLSGNYADRSQKPDPGLRKDILSVVRRILPGSVYYCLSGQVTIWLISLFGSTRALAQVGALGRLAMILSVFSVLFGTLIIPRFARMPNNKTFLFNRYLLLQAGLVIISILAISMAWFFPMQILWILGKGYANLKNELVLSIAGSCLSLIAGSSFSLSTSRGWVISPVISIGITLSAILSGIFLINISSLGGVLKFNLYVSSAEIIMYITYCIMKIRKVSEEIILPATDAFTDAEGELLMESVYHDH